LAKIIATAGVRLKIDGSGLSASIRLVLKNAIDEASKGLGKDSTKGVEDDAKRTSQRVSALFASAFKSVTGLASSLGSAILSGSRLLLLGAAAGGALASVSSLSAALIALVGAAAQAGAAVGILPAALLAVKAVTATVQLGLKGMSEAFKALADNDSAAFNEALKRLSPSAQAFARAVQGLKPAFDQLQLGVQERLFAGLGAQVQALGKQYLPVARSLFYGLATSINASAKEVAGFLRSQDAFRDVATTTGNIRAGFDAARTAAVPFTQAILSIVAAGSTQLPRLGEAIGQIGKNFGDFIGDLAESGRLEEIFSQALDTASQLGRILGNVGQAIGMVFSAGQAQGAGLLANLEGLTSTMVDFLGSFEGQAALQGFFGGIGSLVSNILPLITTLAAAIGTSLAPIISNLANGIGPGLLALFEQIAPALQAAGPGISALGVAFGQVLAAIAPVLPAIGQLVGQLAGLFAQALTAILPTLTGFIEKITSSPGAFAGFAGAIAAVALVFSNLGPIIATIGPFLSDMLTKVGGVKGAFTALGGPVGIAIGLFLALLTGSEEFRNAIGQLLKVVGTLVGSLLATLMPVLQQLFDSIAPVIAQLGSALAPVVTLIADLLQAVLTPVIAALAPVVAALDPVFKALSETLGLVISVVTPLINLLINLLMPVIQALAPVVTTVFTVIADVITAALDVVMGTIEFTLGILTGDWSRAFKGLEQIVNGAMNLVKTIILGALQIVVSVFANTWNAVVGFVTVAWSAIRSAVSAGVSGVVDFVSNLPGRILGFFVGFGSLLYNAGADLLRGLMNGISSMVGQVIGRAKQIGSDILNGVKSALGISSPSKEMAKLGVFAGEGLIVGLESMTAQIMSVAEAAGQAMLTAAGNGVNGNLNLSTASVGANGSAAGPVVFQQTNIQQPGVDAKQFADYTSKNQAYTLASAGTLRSVQLGPVQQGMQSSDTFVGVGGGAL
jgi:phage-related protein